MLEEAMNDPYLYYIWKPELFNNPTQRKKLKIRLVDSEVNRCHVVVYKLVKETFKASKHTIESCSNDELEIIPFDWVRQLLKLI